MVKDYWVYQKRQSDTVQWALYIVKEFTKYKPETVILDFTVYSEDIPTPTNSKSFIGLHYGTARGYTDAITAEMSEYTGITNEDYEQIEIAITRILQD
jgi:hypothetical protein